MAPMPAGGGLSRSTPDIIDLTNDSEEEKVHPLKAKPAVKPSMTVATVSNPQVALNLGLTGQASSDTPSTATQAAANQHIQVSRPKAPSNPLKIKAYDPIRDSPKTKSKASPYFNPAAFTASAKSGLERPSTATSVTEKIAVSLRRRYSSSVSPATTDSAPSPFGINANVINGASKPREPEKVVPSKRKLESTLSLDSQHDHYSYDSVVDRRQRQPPPERKGRTSFSDLLQKAQSAIPEIDLDDDDDELPSIIPKRMQDSLTSSKQKRHSDRGLRDILDTFSETPNGEGLRAAKSLLQHAINLNGTNRTAEKAKSDITEAVPRAVNNHDSTTTSTASEPSSSVVATDASQENLPTSSTPRFSLPSSFATLKDDVLRHFQDQKSREQCQTRKISASVDSPDSASTANLQQVHKAAVFDNPKPISAIERFPVSSEHSSMFTPSMGEVRGSEIRKQAGRQSQPSRPQAAPNTTKPTSVRQSSSPPIVLPSKSQSSAYSIPPASDNQPASPSVASRSAASLNQSTTISQSAASSNARTSTPQSSANSTRSASIGQSRALGNVSQAALYSPAKSTVPTTARHSAIPPNARSSKAQSAANPTRPSNRTMPEPLALKYFPESTLEPSIGGPFTRAECILIIYFAERKMAWTILDHKMGRTKNCCCTKYARRGGLKERDVQLELDYDRYVPFLDSQLKVWKPPTMVELLAALNKQLGADAKVPVKAPSRVHNDAQNTIRKSAVPFNSHQSSTRKTTQQPLIATGTKAPTARNHSYPHRPLPFANPAKPTLLRREFQAHKSYIRLGDELSRPNSSGSSLISADDEGPRLRERRNIKKYTFTRADFGGAAESDSDQAAESGASDDEEEYHQPLVEKKFSAIRETLYSTQSASSGRLKPYLSNEQRTVLQNELADGAGPVLAHELRWNGVELHVPMTTAETNLLRSLLMERLGTNEFSVINRKSDAWIRDFALRSRNYLEDRSWQSIEAFLLDARKGSRLVSRATLQLGLRSPPARSLHSRLLNRELGQQMAALSIRDVMRDSLQPTVSFTGASGDVSTVAWSRNGNTFAAGSVAIVDTHSMQYNRRNNLLLGNFDRRDLVELPHHSRTRVKPAEGPNSTDAMHVTQDRRLFETVSAVDFSPDGAYMYSAGYDSVLRAYAIRDTSSTEPVWSYDHERKIELLAVNPDNLFATGCRDLDRGVRVFRKGMTSGFEKMLELAADRATSNRQRQIYPSALKFGLHPQNQSYLLAGFSSNSLDGTDETIGEICLYDVTRRTPIQISPQSGNVFDCAWSPSSFHCAVARRAVSNQVGRGIKSQILVFRPDGPAYKNLGITFECPALDVNDVVFSPHDYNYVAAGATDGRVYIWDMRNPDTILHTLRHGPPCMEIDRAVSRERADTGVRFTSWHIRTDLYSGSSDGVVKSWDVYRAPEDVYRRDVVSLNSGVMSGAFSPDHNRLLLGEVNGAITVLEANLEQRSLKDMETFNLRQAENSNNDFTTSSFRPFDEDSGVGLGNALRRSKQIKFKPMGALTIRQAVQGRNYNGPYDRAPDAEMLRREAEKFQKGMAQLAAQAIENPCDIPGCDSPILVTKEDEGDSGRSSDRIPQAIRENAETVGEGKGTVRPGMIRCSHCDSLARPRIGDEEQERYPLCERCGFSCFRCGQRVKVDARITHVTCKACDLSWKIGALGYALLEERAQDTMKGVERALVGEVDGGGDGDTVDEEGDAYELMEYYHGLWEDKADED